MIPRAKYSRVRSFEITPSPWYAKRRPCGALVAVVYELGGTQNVRENGCRQARDAARAGASSLRNPCCVMSLPLGGRCHFTSEKPSVQLNFLVDWCFT